MSKVIQDGIGFTLLRSCDWSREHAPSSPPIRFKSITSRNVVTRLFPRLGQFFFKIWAFMNSLRNFLCSEGLNWLLWNCFFTTFDRDVLQWKGNWGWISKIQWVRLKKNWTLPHEKVSRPNSDCEIQNTLRLNTQITKILMFQLFSLKKKKLFSFDKFIFTAK